VVRGAELVGAGGVEVGGVPPCEIKLSELKTKEEIANAEIKMMRPTTALKIMVRASLAFSVSPPDVIHKNPEKAKTLLRSA
jgi:hypothetical protein